MRRTCITKGCTNLAPEGKRKCNECMVSKLKVTAGKPCMKGRNARGTCLHKADKSRTKKAKRQQTGGLPPSVASTRWNWV